MLFSLCSPGVVDQPGEIVVTGYVGRDNSIDLLLTERAAPSDVNFASAGQYQTLPVSHLTRVVFELGEYTLDSALNADYFDLSKKDSFGREKLVIYPGRAISDPVEGLARLIVFDTNNTSGIVWIDQDATTPPILRVRMLDYDD